MFWATLGVVIALAAISTGYKAIRGSLDERARRLVAAAESQAIGRGGVSAGSKATGMSRPVIRQGRGGVEVSFRPGDRSHQTPGRWPQEGRSQRRLPEDGFGKLT